MPNLTPVSSFDNVPELETSTIALGGPGAPMNLPQQALLNRTEYLKDHKRDLVQRVQSIVSAGTVTPDVDTDDAVVVTALAAAATIAAPTGTPTSEQRLTFRFKDDGTPRALTWNAVYAPCGQALPTTTVAGKVTRCGFIYNSTQTRYELVALSQEA